MSNLISNILQTRGRRRTILLTAIILVLALVLLIIFNVLLASDTNIGRLLNWSDPTKYQAVFLSNGQIYFGQVVDVNSQTLVLEDIYYLRMSQALQTGTEDLPAQAGDEPTADNFSLIKLGNEIHGPEDRMNINIDHVLFIEDLQDRSKVVEAIEAYKRK